MLALHFLLVNLNKYCAAVFDLFVLIYFKIPNILFECLPSQFEVLSLNLLNVRKLTEKYKHLCINYKLNNFMSTTIGA